MQEIMELTAIDALTRTGCRLILNEVFECDEPDALVERGDVFFSTLPQPDVRLSLAKTSPLNSVALDEGNSEPPTAPDAAQATRR